MDKASLWKSRAWSTRGLSTVGVYFLIYALHRYTRATYFVSGGILLGVIDHNGMLANQSATVLYTIRAEHSIIAKRETENISE